jgi:hypothetical protein
VSDASARLEACKLPRPILVHVDDIEADPASPLIVDDSGKTPNHLTEHDLLVPVLVVAGTQKPYRIASGEYQWRTFVARRNLGLTQYEYIQARNISTLRDQPPEHSVISATLLEMMPPSVHKAGRDALEELRPLIGGTYKYQPNSPTASQGGGTYSARTIQLRTTLRQLATLFEHTNIADVEAGHVAALELEIVELKEMLIKHGLDIPRNDADLPATLLNWVNDLALQDHGRFHHLKDPNP